MFLLYSIETPGPQNCCYSTTIDSHLSGIYLTFCFLSSPNMYDYQTPCLPYYPQYYDLDFPRVVHFWTAHLETSPLIMACSPLYFISLIDIFPKLCNLQLVHICNCKCWYSRYLISIVDRGCTGNSIIFIISWL